PLLRPLALSGRAAQAQFSPEGKRVLLVSHEEAKNTFDVQIWHPDTGRSLFLARRAKSSQQASFDRAGNRVLLAGADGHARVWDAKTGKPVSPILKHKQSVVDASFSPDGRRLLVRTGRESYSGIADMERDHPAEAWVWDIEAHTHNLSSPVEQIGGI